MNNNWKKNVLFFLSGQAVSVLGSMLVQYAIVWHIVLKTQSGSMMTVIILAGILPMFFIAPLGGVWADRYNKKYLIAISDGVIAFVTLIVALLFLAGFENIWLLLCCAAVRALGQGVQNPASGAFIPEITPQPFLNKVNGFNASIVSFIMLAAPMLSGMLLNFASIKLIFFIDICTAVCGILILLFLVDRPAKEQTADAAMTEPDNASARPEPSAGAHHLRDIADGLLYIKRHPFILQLVLISIVFYIAVSPAAFLTALQVTRTFGADIWRLTVVEAAFSAGMMAGGMIIGLWGGFKNRSHSMSFACFVMGLGTIALGLLTDFWLYLTVMALIGTTLPLYNTPSQVMLQSKVEPAYMGRVFSVFTMVSSLMMPAGMLIWGPLGDRIQIETILIVTGAVVCLLAIPFRVNKALLNAGRIPR